MANDNIKTLLLVTPSGPNSLFPFLFEFTKQWAAKGRQLLYISKSRIESLPPSLGKIGRPDPHVLKLMQFMYLAKWKDVLYQLATIQIRRFQVCAIVVDNIVDYFEDKPKQKSYEDHVSCVCASLLFAVLRMAANSSECIALVCGYVSEDSKIEQNLIKNFFHNIWELQSDSKIFKLLKRSPAKENEIISFTYRDDSEGEFYLDRTSSRMQLTDIIKKVFEV